jgi:cell division inhibitor SulA
MREDKLFSDKNHDLSFKEQSLEALLQKNPALWKGAKQTINAGPDGIRSGYPTLDAILPWKGWPRQGLVEIISARDIGELHLLMPVLRSLSQQQLPSVWIAPPHIPYAPALLQAGIALEHVFIVRSDISWRQTLWSLEKALQTAGCPLVLAWLGQLNIPVLRRLQLAAQSGQTLGVLFHQRHISNSPSALQLAVQPGKLSGSHGSLEVRVLRARGSHCQLSTVISMAGDQS